MAFVHGLIFFWYLGMTRPDLHHPMAIPAVWGASLSTLVVLYTLVDVAVWRAVGRYKLARQE